MQEAHGPDQRVLPGGERGVTILVAEFEVTTPIVIVELEPGLPMHIWPARGEDGPKHCVRIDPAEAELVVDVISDLGDGQGVLGVGLLAGVERGKNLERCTWTSPTKSPGTTPRSPTSGSPLWTSKPPRS